MVESDNSMINILVPENNKSAIDYVMFNVFHNFYGVDYKIHYIPDISDIEIRCLNNEHNSLTFIDSLVTSKDCSQIEKYHFTEGSIKIISFPLESSLP
jgi:hypothetical protein